MSPLPRQGWLFLIEFLKWYFSKYWQVRTRPVFAQTVTYTVTIVATQSEACTTDSAPCNDPAMYIDKTFNDNEKFRILNEKWVSPTNFSFPMVV